VLRELEAEEFLPLAFFCAVALPAVLELLVLELLVLRFALRP